MSKRLCVSPARPPARESPLPARLAPPPLVAPPTPPAGSLGRWRLLPLRGAPRVLAGWLRRALTMALLPRSLKSGKVVVMLQGRHAGKKAVIVRQVRAPAPRADALMPGSGCP